MNKEKLMSRIKKTSSELITTKEETFVQEIVKGNSQYNAYIKAYPDRKKWTRSAIDCEASRLRNLAKIYIRIEEASYSMREKLEKKALWTRELAILELRKILDTNTEEQERLEVVFSDEVSKLIEDMNKETNTKKRNKIYTELLKAQKQVRKIQSLTNAKITAIESLNKMMGYNTEKVITTDLTSALDSTLNELSIEELKSIAGINE